MSSYIYIYIYLFVWNRARNVYNVLRAHLQNQIELNGSEFREDIFISFALLDVSLALSLQ